MSHWMNTVCWSVVVMLAGLVACSEELPTLAPPEPKVVPHTTPAESTMRVVTVVKVTGDATDGQSEDETSIVNYVLAYDAYFISPQFAGQLPDDAKGVSYSLDDLTERLATERQQLETDDKTMTVDLHVDHSLDYERVQPIMTAIISANITTVNLIATKSTSHGSNP